MRCLPILLATLLLIGSEAAAVAKPAPKAKQAAAFSSPDLVLQWINTYRERPDPARLPYAVQAMSKLGLFREQETAGIYIGFIAGVIGGNPGQADQLVARMFPMAPEEQVILIKAIAFSGLPDWKELLGRFIERMPARKVLIERYLYDKSKVLSDLPLETGPQVLDANWGYYFATGSEQPVTRIIAALAMSADKNDIEKLTIGSMAKWTLATNASRYAEILAICKAELGRHPKEVVVPLRDVIEAAETFEIARVRKQAIASIDELRAKGPQRNRDTAWWVQAGSTAFALGCVGAAALGQVEFGIPCVIGGPLGTAAAKYLIPQQ